MNQNDLNQFFEALKQHYPNTNAGDLEMVGETVRALSYEQAMAALRSIRMSEKLAYRPSIPKFAERAKRMAESLRPDRQRVSREIISFIRSRSDSRDLCKGVDDIHAIEIHFKRAWETVQEKCDDPTAINSGRRMILGHCRLACFELQWSDQDATDFARLVVDLKPGEMIPKPTKIFNDMPAPDRKTSFEAVADLAVAEHAKPDAVLIEENAEAT